MKFVQILVIPGKGQFIPGAGSQADVEYTLFALDDTGGVWVNAPERIRGRHWVRHDSPLPYQHGEFL